MDVVVNVHTQPQLLLLSGVDRVDTISECGIALPHIREGRLLNGEKRLSAADYFNEKQETEPIIYADLDKHHIDATYNLKTFRKRVF